MNPDDALVAGIMWKRLKPLLQRAIALCLAPSAYCLLRGPPGDYYGFGAIDMAHTTMPPATDNRSCQRAAQGISARRHSLP